MPSLIQGFAYDIFISYRHNDNRSGWITDFVNALQEELAATIKEPVSVYFDTNPHDGLLETHNVDKSLEGKLKCLIFIPIISQTYCDTKSFAWQHEFCAFNKLSQEDQLGRDIRLSNGNVASRVLPVKIHELDNDDKNLLENELGGVLRAIEFIHKTAGVNRPLTSRDDEVRTPGKILYRDQVNKVANAIKEIITALKHPVPHTPQTIHYRQPPTKTSAGKKVYAVIILFVLVLSTAGYFLYPKLIPTGKTVEVNDRSLAVLPFVDMSPAKDQEWFSDGLTEELLNSLTGLPELKLISRTSSFAFKGKNLPIRKIADSLHVSYVVEGSVRKADKQVRITVQLIKASDGTHLWSNTYDRTMDDIFNIQKDISENIAHALNVVLDEKSRANLLSSGTRNVDAYEAFLKGRSIFNVAHLTTISDLIDANIYFDKAISLDPKFADAYFFHSDLYAHTLLEAPEFASDTPKKEIYSLLINDVNSAIEFSDSPLEKINYELDKIFLSDDWSEVPSLIRRLRDADAIINYGWGLEFLIAMSPEMALENYTRLLENDPLNEYYERSVVWSLITMNELDSAMQLLANDRKKKNSVYATEEWAIEIIKGDFNSAMNIAEKNFTGMNHPRQGQYLLSQLLSGNYPGSMTTLKTRLDTMGMDAIAIYNALGKYEKADSLARFFDSKFLGPCILGNYLTGSSTGRYYFHLSATPNRSARLRELGIDPAAYEKKYYHQLPVVTLKSN